MTEETIAPEILAALELPPTATEEEALAVIQNWQAALFPDAVPRAAFDAVLLRVAQLEARLALASLQRRQPGNGLTKLYH